MLACPPAWWAAATPALHNASPYTNPSTPTSMTHPSLPTDSSLPLLASAEEASLAARTGFGLASDGQEPLAGAADGALDPKQFAAASAASEKVSDAMLAGFKSSLEELMAKLEAEETDDEE